MKRTNVFAAIALLVLSMFNLSAQEGPVGWASFGDGTTGGQGGDTVIATTRNELAAYLDSDDPLVVMFEDTINLVPWERMRIASNKSFIGMGRNATIRLGGFEVEGDNVIIQNIAITDSYDGDWEGKTHSTDAITIYGQNVWVDHCDVSACADGLIDIRANNGVAANFVTISYTRFSNHNKVMLFGSSNDEIEDRGKLKTTIHHCWFDGTIERGLNQRMPRTRFGDVHIYNNYFEGIDSYCSAARLESDLVVEYNYYRSSNDPHFIDDVGLGIEDPELRAENNIYEFSNGRKESRGFAFDPGIFYDYAQDSTVDVPALVMNEAGLFNPPGNMAPEAVNDTLRLDGTGGLKILDVIANDTDVDSGNLRIARVINDPAGFAQVRNNTINYVAPPQDIARDTIYYQLVDTQGGVDTGFALVLSEISSADSPSEVEFSIDIFPNPADTHCSVNIRGSDLAPESSDFQVIDIHGRSCGRIVSGLSFSPDGRSATFVVNMAGEPAGTYIVVLQQGLKAHSRMFTVAH